MSEYWTMVGVVKQVSGGDKKLVRVDMGASLWAENHKHQFSAPEARDLARRLLQAANEIDGLGFEIFQTAPAKKTK